MDFSTNTSPYFPTTWDEWKDLLTFGRGPKWLTEVTGNFALLGAGGVFLSKGRVFSQSFKLSPGISKLTASIVPFTISAAEPGVIHLVADIAFYKAASVFKTFDDLAQRYAEWLQKVSDAELRQALGPAGYDLVTSGGTVTNLKAIIEIPPAWLTDP